MNIEITPKRSEGLERFIEVKVPVETVTDAENRAAKKYATSVRLPGFRPGKAPPAIVKKRFRDAIRQQVVEQLVQEAFQEVVDREKYKVAAQPHIHHLKFEEGEPLSFELHLELRPELSLERTSGFRVTRPASAVTDEQVQEQLDQLRDQRASWSPVEEKPREGDMVTVQLSTAEEGGEFPEPREYRIVIGGGQAIPGVEELVMTLKPGESTEQPVRWPEDFPDEAERGKTKPVRVKLDDVKRKAVAPLDDAFAREVGDFDSLDALTAAVRRDLEEHSTRDADANVRQQIVDQIVQANPFDVPHAWVQSLLEAYVKAYQVPEEEAERFATEFRPVAERQVRRDLIVDAIAEKENLKATEADIDARVAELAAKRNADVSQVYMSLQKAGRLKEIEQSLTEDKVFAWLLSKNEVA
ncbi:MAG TPA: trigger factor [Gemmatimonadaceae bacterium]|nr:trigger factor [Gemmatimonadaceae bacterium]